MAYIACRSPVNNIYYTLHVWNNASMTPNAPTREQKQSLASFIAAHDGRGHGNVSAERYHIDHIDKCGITGEEVAMVMEHLMSTPEHDGREVSERMLLCRLVSESMATKTLHLLFTLLRCHRTLAHIANHHTSGYDDYPVVTIQDLYRDHLNPSARWGERLSEETYDQMASLLVALYLNKALCIYSTCMLRINLYSHVIEPLVNNMGVISRNVSKLLTVTDALAQKMQVNFWNASKMVNLTSEDIIFICGVLEAHEGNLERILDFVEERGFINAQAIRENFLLTPVLVRGGL